MGYDFLPLTRLDEGLKYATSMLSASREEGESENGRAKAEAVCSDDDEGKRCPERRNFTES